MSKNCNPTCLACGKATNCINGRYCQQLCMYVQYYDYPPCKEGGKE